MNLIAERRDNRRKPISMKGSNINDTQKKKKKRMVIDYSRTTKGAHSL